MATVLSELKDQMRKDGYFKDGLDLHELILFGEVYCFSDVPIWVCARLGACVDCDVEYFINLLAQMQIDEDYGIDPVRGTIWLVDRTFYRRANYDECGYWEHIKIDPPSYLDPNQIFAS